MKNDKKAQKSKYNIWVLLGGSLIWLYLAVNYFMEGDTSGGIIMLVIGVGYSGIFIANMLQKKKNQETRKP